MLAVARAGPLDSGSARSIAALVRNDLRRVRRFSLSRPVGVVLAVFAVALQIGRQNGGQGGRLQADTLQRAAFFFGRVRDHIVGLEQFHLVGGERRHREHLEHLAHGRGDREGDRQQGALAPCHGQHVGEAVPEAFDLRSAELIGARAQRAVDGAGDGFRDIADIDRLELRLAAAEQRQHRREARHVGVELIGPEAGALEGMLNEFVGFGRAQVGSMGAKTSDNPLAQLAVADARNTVDELMTILNRNFDVLMGKIRAGQPLDDIEQRLHFRNQASQVVERCAQSAWKLFSSTGGQGIFTTLPYYRYLNDIQAARGHYANNPDQFARNYGAVSLGAENADYFI